MGATPIRGGPPAREGEMRRFHLLEIEDQSWCPPAVRDGVTDFLQFMSDAGRLYAPAAPILAAALRRGAATRVVDLAGGAGGAWRSLLPALAEQGAAPSVQLTDRHPNVVAFARVERDTHGAVAGYPHPVDAAAVPAELSGLRTIFAALHHFRPAEVREVLRDATARGEGFAAFEPMHRDLRAMLLTCLTPLVVLLVTPRLRPFRWSRLFWTYLLPAIPLVVLVDGVVSCLRTYTPAELRAMAAEVEADGYQWDAGEIGSGPIPVTYLVGLPSIAPS
jgi:hypothetical protein